MIGRFDLPRRQGGSELGIGRLSACLSLKDQLRFETDRNVCPTESKSSELRSIPQSCSSHTTATPLASPCLSASVVSFPPSQRKAAA